MDWREWFQAQGVPQAPTESAMTFNDYTLVIEAAAAGLGVALGWAPLVNDMLDRGELVAAHDTPLQTARGYFLLAPRRPAPSGPQSRFRDWLVQACAGTPPWGPS
jgi:DNA-binding transcriptional LysR family regulator